MPANMLLHAINQAALVKSTDNSGNSCNMRVKDTLQVMGVPHTAIDLVLVDGQSVDFPTGCGAVFTA